MLILKGFRIQIESALIFVMIIAAQRFCIELRIGFARQRDPLVCFFYYEVLCLNQRSRIYSCDTSKSSLS